MASSALSAAWLAFSSDSPIWTSQLRSSSGSHEWSSNPRFANAPKIRKCRSLTNSWLSESARLVKYSLTPVRMSPCARGAPAAGISRMGIQGFVKRLDRLRYFVVGSRPVDGQRLQEVGRHLLPATAAKRAPRAGCPEELR